MTLALALAHGPDRIPVDATGRGLADADYRAFFGIAPLGVRATTGAAADWLRLAHRIEAGEEAGSSDSHKPLAAAVADCGAVGFARTVRLAEQFLALHAERCFGAEAPRDVPIELWAVKEGATASVWCAHVAGKGVALNVARDRVAAEDLAGSAVRLAAMAASLDRGLVAEPIAEAWIDGLFILAQRWVEGADEIGIFRTRGTGQSVLMRVERFLTGGDHPAMLAGVSGWPWRGEARSEAIAQIVDLACAGAASCVERGIGAAGFTIAHGDLVWADDRPIIVACDGQQVAAGMPSARELAAALLADAGADAALSEAFAAAAEKRLVADREPGTAAAGRD